MNEKEMISLIKQLTKVIEKQAEYASQLTTQMTSTLRFIGNLQARVSRLEGMQNVE